MKTNVHPSGMLPGAIPINLALQGGGAHGAYTWGVVHELLKSKKFWISAISGTSAGAMNAAMIVSGLAKHGTSGARETLESFWTDVGKINPFHVLPIEKALYGWQREKSPIFQMQQTMAAMFSPYHINPCNYHPLREIIEKHVDFSALQSGTAPRLFIAATDVESGDVKIFENAEINIDVLLASACLPTLFQAVEIDGRFYYDGGYMGNPALYPLYSSDTALEYELPHDIVLIEINPLERKGVPKTIAEIHARRDEINFNSALRHELRAIAFVQKLTSKGEARDKKHLRMHMVDVSNFLVDSGTASKMNTDPDFLEELRKAGQTQAKKWIQFAGPSVGKRSTMDIHGKYLKKTKVKVQEAA